MNSVIITFSDYTAGDPRFHTMIRWCFDNVGEENKDWQWRYREDPYDFEFIFKKNKMATMFRLKFYNE
jgi:hypothetical protein